MWFPSSKCPHCKSMNFELTRTEPNGSRVALYFVQCTSCKAPMGVTGYYDPGSMLKAQEQKIEALERKIDSMSYDIQSIMQALNYLRRAA